MEKTKHQSSAKVNFASELSIGDFAAILWSRKWLIAACVIAGSLMGLVLTSLTSKTYRAVAHVSALPPAYMEEFFQPQSAAYSAQEAFALGLVEIESPEMQMQVFKRHFGNYIDHDASGHLLSESNFENQFSRKVGLKLLWPDRKSLSGKFMSARISFDHEDSAIAVSVLEDLIASANKAVLHTLTERRERMISSELKGLEHRLAQAKLMQQEGYSDAVAATIMDLRLSINVLKNYPNTVGKNLQVLSLTRPIDRPSAAARPIKAVALGLGATIGLLLAALAAIYRHTSSKQSL